ncbi:MAG: WD40/YVTN/BNR-like repeat-containing protein [Acidimicrobiia bacterium]
MTSTPTLLVGTRKGVFFLEGDRDRANWQLRGPMHLGHIAQHVVLDPRNQRRLLVGASTGHLGPTVFLSDDLGGSWREAKRPPAFRTGEPLQRALKTVFWLAPGHLSQPDVWFAGGSPQGLFRSDDGGETWAPFDGWNDHPMWATWAEWPEQNTPDGSMLHSINIDPRDANHLYIGLSSGGVFESTDGGIGWAPINAGCKVDFLPEEEPEFGQDPHCVRIHPLHPDRLWQQSHFGIYRMDRADARWTRVGDNMPRTVGDIGFPIELHPRDPDTAWVFPMDGTDVWPRTSPGGHAAVYVTRDGGESWTCCDEGLPQPAWFTVKRQAMTTDDHDDVGVYFGTTSGEIWASRDEGVSWTCVAAHLPEIYSIEYASPER